MFKNVFDRMENLYREDLKQFYFQKNMSIKLNGGLTIGGMSPTRVNCNVGCNSLLDYPSELSKLRKIKDNGELPDMMMDLSLIDTEKPLYLAIRDELRLPFGTVLSYHGFNKSTGLSWGKTKVELIRLCNDGVSFLTVHFTSDLDLFQDAKSTRRVPMTSRGGGIVLYDSVRNGRTENLFLKHIDEIAEIALAYDVVISLGTTFRPATIFDACDKIHLEETRRQLKICMYLQGKGVKVMVENIGHISLDKLSQHAKLLKLFNAPIMPLGPLPTDAAIGIDHIANAIGSSFAAQMGITHIINCVTRYEHSQSQITADVTLEAIRTARLAAHIADVARQIPEALAEDDVISTERAKLNNCFADGKSCKRCSDVCPLKIVAND